MSQRKDSSRLHHRHKDNVRVAALRRDAAWRDLIDLGLLLALLLLTLRTVGAT